MEGYRLRDRDKKNRLRYIDYMDMKQTNIQRLLDIDRDRKKDR